MNKQSEGFAYLRQMFSHINDVKIKEDLSTGPQIQDMMDSHFDGLLQGAQCVALTAFKNVFLKLSRQLQGTKLTG